MKLLILIFHFVTTSQLLIIHSNCSPADKIVLCFGKCFNYTTYLDISVKWYKRTWFTWKCERAERVGGGGEEEANEEATVCSAGNGGRTFGCWRRWSKMALHTLCSSSILGPAGTLHKGKIGEHQQQQRNATCTMYWEYKMALCWVKQNMKEKAST